jgi:hypothetical protein
MRFVFGSRQRKDDPMRELILKMSISVDYRPA